MNKYINITSNADDAESSLTYPISISKKFFKSEYKYFKARTPDAKLEIWTATGDGKVTKKEITEKEALTYFY